MAENPTIIGYILLNPDGIPIRIHERMPYRTALTYSSEVLDFMLRSRNAFKEMFGDEDGSLVNSFRLRSNDQTELAVTCHNDYVLVVVQNCSGTAWHWPDELVKSEI